MANTVMYMKMCIPFASAAMPGDSLLLCSLSFTSLHMAFTSSTNGARPRRSSALTTCSGLMVFFFPSSLTVLASVATSCTNSAGVHACSRAQSTTSSNCEGSALFEKQQ